MAEQDPAPLLGKETPVESETIAPEQVEVVETLPKL